MYNLADGEEVTHLLDFEMACLPSTTNQICLNVVEYELRIIGMGPI